jgi:transposase
MKLIRIIDRTAPRVKGKYHVTLTGEEREGLRKLVTTGRAAARARRHAEVLLAADASAAGPGLPDVEIAAKYDVGLTTIGRVRQRCVEEGVSAALHPRPRTNDHARKVDGVVEAHLIALACSPAPDGATHWTLRLLADRFVQLDYGCDLSYETIRRVLKKKRTETLAEESLVHSAGSERGVRLSHGRRAVGVSATRRSALSAGLHGRTPQATRR